MKADPKEYIERKSIPVPMAGCWLWLGGIAANGYGIANVKRRPVGAHRVSWAAFNGPIPDGLHVLHHCDTPACVNPDHLFLGTAVTNMQDKMNKGRHRNALGEENGHAKLTANEVREIRSSPLSRRELSRLYGVGVSAVRQIQNRQRWKHI